MTLENQIKFMEEHSRQSRFEAEDQSYKGDKFEAEDRAEALTEALRSLNEYLALKRSFEPLVKSMLNVKVTL